LNETERIARAYQEMEARAGLRWSLANAGNRSMLAERRRIFRDLLEHAGWLPLGEKRALEIGAGTGTELAWLLEVGAVPANLVGVELLANRVATARHAFPNIQFRQANAERLEDADGTYDLVLAITLFSSILDRAMAANVAGEITRVLKPGGALLWYDVRYDSVSNRNVRAVTAARVRDLFPSLRGEVRTLTLLPPLARRLGPLTGAGYPVLSALPPLRSHLLGLLRKPEGD